MASPAEIVTQQFALAQNYAQSAQTKLTNFVNALTGSIFVAPTVSGDWISIEQPGTYEAPDVPELQNVEFRDPGNKPSALQLELVVDPIETFAEAAPTTVLPTAPVVNLDRPVPTVPEIGAVPIPDAPSITLPSTPNYLTLNPVVFGGVDLREDWLERLEDSPTLDLLAPTPYTYTRGPEYASELLDKLQAVLSARINGGSGLNPAVEQAIWDRSRSRETQIAQANRDDVMRASESLGFLLPPGVLAAQLRQADQDYYDKLSSLSRDIAIKQADLEQQNLRETITAGIQLEGQLIDYSLKLEQLTFESAKALADNAIQAYNAQVGRFSALVQAYETYASVYKTIIDGQLAKVEVYKAQLAGEQAKADINRTLVEQYKATIDALQSQVSIYQAQVGAANTLVQLEQTKISAAAEQIRGFVAQINAETAKVETFKASVEAENTKLAGYKIKADVYSAKVGAQAERARAQTSRFVAQTQAYSAQWDGYRAAVAAESERLRGLTSTNSLLVDGYRIAASAAEAQSNAYARQWEASIKQYEGQQNFHISLAKINSDIIASNNAARLDAAKAGTQVYAQQVASAYGLVQTQASIRGDAQTSVSYNYGGSVSGSVSPIVAI